MLDQTTQRNAVPLLPLKTLPAAVLAVIIAIPCAVPANAQTPAGVGTASPVTGQSFQCRYQATAYITFLSLTIFSRSGVGFGFASVDEHLGSAKQLLNLRFLSGSTPERAHGLNRFGFIQENVERQGESTIAADYFGLMTANDEQSLDDAKAALNSGKNGMVPFVAARAFVTGQQTSYAVRRLLLPSSYRGSNASQLLTQIQAEFAGSAAHQGEKTESFNNRPTGTFLDCLRRAILNDAPLFHSRIVFNGNTFDFQTEKHADVKTGSLLQKAGLTAKPDSVFQLAGSLRNEKTREVSNFRLWFAQGAPNFLPLRFEFKAKPYLRLVFDQEPPLTQRASITPSVSIAP